MFAQGEVVYVHIFFIKCTYNSVFSKTKSAIILIEKRKGKEFLEYV